MPDDKLTPEQALTKLELFFPALHDLYVILDRADLLPSVLEGTDEIIEALREAIAEAPVLRVHIVNLLGEYCYCLEDGCGCPSSVVARILTPEEKARVCEIQVKEPVTETKHESVLRARIQELEQRLSLRQACTDEDANQRNE